MDRGLLSKSDHAKILDLFSRAGLAIDHPLFDDMTIEKGTKAILRTRDGQLRLAVPSSLGQCSFVNEYTDEDLRRILQVHKEVVSKYPRRGDGIEAYVDASDTGEGLTTGKMPTVNGEKPTLNGASPFINGDAPRVDGGMTLSNGSANGHMKANGLLYGAAKQEVFVNGH